ncbi:MAG: hypothetical protein AAB353_02555 [Candidatus Hydrogenedentota bacterium]
MARSSGNIAIVQFSDRTISFLRAAPSSTGVDVLASVSEHGEWTDEFLVAALKDFVRRHDLGGDRVFTVVPRHDVTARIIELPSADQDEIAGMVRLSAAEFVPYAADEIVTSHAVLSVREDGISSVLAVVAHRDVVDRHLDRLTVAGAPPEKVFLSTACLLSAAAASTPADIETYALANLASGGLEVLVLRGTVLEHARGVGSSQEWGTDQSVLDELAAELRSTIAAHRRDTLDGVGASDVFFCSDNADSSAIAEAITHDVDFQCAPATHILEITGTSRGNLNGVPVVALGAVMNAQGRGACIIDLTPRDEKRRRAAAKLLNKAVRIGIAAALLIVSAAALFTQALYQRNSHIAKLERIAEQRRPQVQEMVAKRRHLERMQEEVSRKDSALEMLAAVANLAPQLGLNVNRISFRHGESVDIFGRANQIANVDALATQFRDAGIQQFAAARVMYTDRGKERDQEIYNFHVSIPFPTAEAAAAQPGGADAE